LDVDCGVVVNGVFLKKRQKERKKSGKKPLYAKD